MPTQILAQNLTDPMRPPLFVDAGGASAPAAEPELQSVLISPTRRVAIINGKSVMLGEKVGDGQVVKITENEVVIRNGNELRILKLFPGIQKNVKPHRKESGTESRNR